MTWNLWWRFGDWSTRERAIAAVIADADPDVICLQEVWTDGDDDLARRLADTLGYHGTTCAPVVHDGLGFANAILSRWPVTRRCDHPLPRRDGTPGHRRLLVADVETPWGAWPIGSTHLDHRFDDSASRRQQSQELLRIANDLRGDPTTDLPVVIGGDLNAVPDSDEIRLLTGRRDGVAGIVFSDCWEQAGEGAGVTWSGDNPNCADSAWPDRRLDYVLVSWPRPKPVGNPVAAALAGDRPVPVDGRPVWASDHFAVVVDLVTPG
jgi:endonuclease/exonuclease/phosphatase family metal-dependent hydrolase